MIKFNLVGDSDKLTINPKKIIKKVITAINRNFAIRDKHVVSFIIVNSEKIREINNQYRSLDRTTDVISFAMIDAEENSELPYEMGDVFINYELVKIQAEEYGHSELREFAFLVTHGMLHLLGYDHMDKNDEEIMFKLQEQILNMIKITRKDNS